MTDAELKRLKDAFKRSSTLNGYMTKQVFVREVLGDGVPAKLAEVFTRISQRFFSFSFGVLVDLKMQTAMIGWAIHRAAPNLFFLVYHSAKLCFCSECSWRLVELRKVSVSRIWCAGWSC